jgi:hypothetical protein
MYFCPLNPNPNPNPKQILTSKVKNQFALTTEQLIEVVYVCGLVCDPTQFCLVLLQWCENKILPSGNLLMVITDKVRTKYGGLGYSNKARHQNKFTTRMSKESIIHGLWTTYCTVSYCNNANQIYTVKYANCVYDRALSMLSNVHLFGDLSSQRVLNKFTLTQTVKHACLLTCAKINTGTLTYKRLKKQYCFSKTTMNQVLSVVAYYYQIEKPKAENLLSESLQKRSAYDWFLPQQHK